jgi:hypothetical protein
MNPRPTSNAIGNEKVFRALSYTLVFLMMACVAMTLGSLIDILVPHWHSGIIAGIILFIVLDRFYTYRQLKSLTLLSSEWIIALAAQWILIGLLVRFLLSYANGLDSFRAEMSLIVRGYIVKLFSPEFVITLMLALLIWYLSGQFLELLDEIGLDPQLALREEAPLIQRDAVPAHQRLVNLIFSMGIALVILTVLTRLNLHTILSNTVGIPNVEVSRFSGAEAGALFYFVFGLTLLSLSRLMSLQTHWNRERIPVSSKNLVRQWGIYSLSFLLMLAVIVSLLPAGDSLGFFSLLGTLLSFLIGILFFIGQLFLVLISLLFSLPMLLLHGDPLPVAPAPPPFPVLPPVDPAIPSTSSAVWALIRSILLWGSLLAIIVFAFLQFVRQHGGIRAALRQSRITNWLMLAWQWLYKNADKTRGSLSRAVAEGWQSILSRLEGKRSLPRPGWIRLRSLDPRARIYFFYLAMIRRGGEQGLTRKPSQTPSEYAVTLEKALPSAGEDIDKLTEAFVEARYSRQEVDSRKAELVKATWERIRRALQVKSKSERSADKQPRDTN